MATYNYKLQILVEKWVHLGIGQEATHILSYLASLPVIPSNEFFNAVKTLFVMIENTLTEQTLDFVNKISNMIIWGTDFIPIIESIYERSNDLIESNNIKLRSKLLNAKSTEEFIGKNC